MPIKNSIDAVNMVDEIRGLRDKTTNDDWYNGLEQALAILEDRTPNFRGVSVADSDNYRTTESELPQTRQFEETEETPQASVVSSFSDLQNPSLEDDEEDDRRNAPEDNT